MANGINYEQNDEWVYYENIRGFLNGNYQLQSLTAPSFYSAGLPALLVAKTLGIYKIPVLTLFVSIFSGYILAKILYDHLNKNYQESILLSLLLLLNPLFVYSTWGFITDNYALFYSLVSVFFYIASSKDGKINNLLIGGIFAFLAFNARQIYLVIPIAFSLHSLFKKSTRNFLCQSTTTLLILVYYYFLFPKTPEMFDNNLDLSRITYFRYGFSLTYIVLIYLASLLLPLAFTYIQQNFDTKNLKKEFLILATTTGLLLLTNWYFEPNIVWKDKYYYLINTVQRNGFLDDNIHGSKPDFPLSQIIYQTLDIFGKFFGVYLIVKLISKQKKKIIGYDTAFILIYSALLIISPKIHDRYLIPLFALAILFIANRLSTLTKSQKVFTGIFVIMMGVYSYNFSADYLITNNYVWDTSQRLVQEKNVEPGEIIGTIAWNLKYPSTKKGYDYKFTYDPPQKQNYSTEHELVDSLEIKFPLNLWNTTKVYLYRYTF